MCATLGADAVGTIGNPLKRFLNLMHLIHFGILDSFKGLKIFEVGCPLFRIV
jgi:hypothetical protein